MIECDKNIEKKKLRMHIYKNKICRNVYIIKKCIYIRMILIFDLKNLSTQTLP